MIAIVDGGSTKCDWVLLQNDGKEHFRAETVGFNPNIISEKLISKEVSKNEALLAFADDIKYLFFYGSGCGTKKNQNIVQQELQQVFSTASIIVKEDLLAAAYSAYRGFPEIVCILGTGSNACYFDGKNMRTELPSLGFMIGDEGSGSALGKNLVKLYFHKKLPRHIHEAFASTYKLSIEDLLQNMYHNPRVNAYFAEFTKFVVQYKSDAFIQQMVYKELKHFLEYQVVPYKECRHSELNFIGSVAYFFEDILRAVAAEFHFTVGNIVQRPIESLVDYHRQYILPNL